MASESSSVTVDRSGQYRCDGFFRPEEPFLVRSVENLTEATYVLRTDRHGMQFKPGQAVSAGLYGSGVNREYSIYSGLNDDYLDFLIREVKGGTVSTALRKAEPGSVLNVEGPYSEFTLAEPENTSIEYVFIATGTGIAPFHSIIRSYPHIKYTVLHGIRRADEQYHRGEYQEGSYIPCITKEQVEGSFNGRVTDYIRSNPVDSAKLFYLCGNRGMIEEAFEILREQDVSSSHIITEVFF